MRATVTIDDEKVAELMRFSGARSRTGAVNLAVDEWLRMRRIQELRGLRGRVEIDPAILELRSLEGAEQGGDRE